ncbi:2-isopropylmalate synthase (Alpha-isopropylmalate synthase) (Alpha-IPM synthetase) [Stygiomarasmius scandens]|uniref:2-isopropylmalate synthase n=1 Tax=Marasmiellus scandens TaxID=2682957 RepID=A0ABR1IXY0_9AGAR
MPMLSDPSTKYLPYPDVPFPEGYIRKWPTKRTTVAPRWLSTDLRDGNQALVNPMSNTTKLELFKLLVKIGFKEIEVAYPSASELEFQFCRDLIENNEIPDDVAIQIITPARADLLTKSVAALAGAKHAIIHLYNATSPVFREVVFRNSKEKTIDLTLNAVRLLKKLTEEETARSGTHFTLNYCLETFSQTEPEFAVELGNKVFEEWGRATPEDPIIYNLAATVECGPSNQYADLVEYFSNNIQSRESVRLSIHPHNDRGTAVAAAELGLLAGGDRIEGCLLGNGERTGNVDLITLALNLYSQGVSPKLDFSNLPEIVEVVCRCNESAVPVRYPYAGTLVFSAFAGTHQDAIKKGLDAQEKRWKEVERTGKGIKHWAMPYIPVDPKDLGYGYENLIRVSSQSGKAGTAYVVKQNMGLDLPRRMQVSFYGIVQTECEKSGKEMTTALITNAFKVHYSLSSKPMGRLHLESFRFFPLSPSGEPSSPISDYSDEPFTSSPPPESDGSLVRFEGQLIVDGKQRTIQGDGKGTAAAVLDALKSDLDLDLEIGETYSETLNADNLPQAKTATFVELLSSGSSPSKSGAGAVWGVGISSDVATSKCRALISAANGLAVDRHFPRARMVYTPRRSPSVQRQVSDMWLRDVKLRTGHSVPRTPDHERADIMASS